jgi:glycosyltransferase involved in cell wall biosynthesis
MALVSVVLPVRNGERYLEESIDSVRRQTLPEWELIAVDDASEDRTPQILARSALADQRIRILRSEVPLRLPGALNRGFAHATGAFLTWTSDDNAYRPDALETLVASLRASPGAAIAYAGYSLIDAEGRRVETRQVAAIRHLGYSNVVGPCFLFRREVFENVGQYADDLFLAEDYDFWLRASTKFEFLRLERDLYDYRVHTASLSARRRSEITAAVAEVLRRNLQHMRRRQRFGALTRLEELARAAGSLVDARAWRRRSYLCHPIAAIRRQLWRMRSKRSIGRTNDA